MELSDESFGFSANYTADFSLSDGENKTSTLLNPGTYNVTESDIPDGLELRICNL